MPLAAARWPAQAHARLPAVLLLLAGAACAQLTWVVEPPARLAYSNSSGARLTCLARAAPSAPAAPAGGAAPPPAQPVLDWLGDDGAPLAPIPGLREVYSNGTLVLLPFSASAYRSDVHAAAARCRAATPAGAVLSRLARPEPVMDTWWEARVESGHALAGGAALLTCVVPPAVRAHALARWLQDDRPLPTTDPGGSHVSGAGGWQLVAAAAAAGDRYACEVRHALTGQTRRSPAVTLSVSQPSGSVSPRMLTASSEETVAEGDDLRLLCAAVASPLPEYSWFREQGGRAVQVRSDLRVSATAHALVLRRARAGDARDAGDAGRWWCRAHNALGEQRRHVTLTVRARLTVTVRPALQVAHSGSSVSFECIIGPDDGAGGAVRVRWLHDGAAAGGGERALRVHSVARAHRGMYQCFAERGQDVAQAAAELRLGDTAPELHYTFIEQALHPGPALALQCAASGAPPPRIAWLLDAAPLDDRPTPHRSITQFMTPAGDVVSYLNLTAVRAEDGGRYTCRAANSRGAVEHSARLNVYGPPAVRSPGPVRVVAGVNSTIYCPYSGFPISEIRWSRASGGGGAGGAGGAGGGAADGALRLWPAEAGDAGVYTCRVTAPDARSASQDVQIIVRNPPKISGFSFPTDLVEGSSVQVLCGITSGDKPVYFSWLKDGQHISNSLQVQEKSLGEFSFLIFSSVAARHSGDYTCVASNAAAEVNHTARLAVRVAPTWVYEPQNVSVLLGSEIVIHCATKGYPEPRVTWLKEHGVGTKDFRAISNLEYQVSILANGSLSARAARREHAGRYRCRADNGVGRGLDKEVGVAVHEPAAVEAEQRNVSVARGASTVLACRARGDAPLALRWWRADRAFDADAYRVSISEKRSELSVSSRLSLARAERADGGVWRCRADNAHGRDEALIYLAVQELPATPTGLTASRVWSRGALLRWRSGDYSAGGGAGGAAGGVGGGAAAEHYRLQLRALGAAGGGAGAGVATDTALADADWTHAPVVHVPADAVRDSGDGWLQYSLGGLRPAAQYAARLAGVNALGASHYTAALRLRTAEEAPSSPPHNVHVQASAPGELLVTWQPPPQDTWNGELLGYSVSWRAVAGVTADVTDDADDADDADWQAAADSVDAAALAATRGAQSALGWGAVRTRVAGLRAGQHYVVRVRAFTAPGAGPASTPVTITTLEGEPEWSPTHVRCSPLSATALRVRWLPAPGARTDRLLGYEIIYETWVGASRVWSRRAAGAAGAAGAEGAGGSGGGAAELGGLRRASNYSVAVSARAAAGSGPPSDPVYCATHADAPGPPADIKAAAASSDSIAVSWLPPPDAGDQITHYTVYTRPQWSGQQSSLLVPHTPLQREYVTTVRVASGAGGGAGSGAGGGAAVDAWVTASSAAGEGAMSTVVTATTNARAPARIMSFGGVVREGAGRRVRVPCASAGSPPPAVTWRRGAGAGALGQAASVEGTDLVIHRLEPSTEDNYTCVSRNAWGVDRAAWRVLCALPPPAPRARLLAAAPAALQLEWDAPPGNADVQGYVIEYRRSDVPGGGGGAWGSLRAAGDARAAWLRRLACGARYAVRVRAVNARGAGPPAALAVATLGGPARAAPAQQVVWANASCARVNLLPWDGAGCALAAFRLELTRHPASSTRTLWVRAGGGAAWLCALPAGAWHRLRVAARGAGAPTTHDYYFATLTADGEPVTEPAPEGWDGAGAWGGAWGGAASGVGGALLAAALLLLLVAALLACRRGSLGGCPRKAPAAAGGGGVRRGVGGAGGGGPLPAPPAGKACSDARAGRQLYTSSPVKPLHAKEQELYEISPYATFSMGAGSLTAGNGGGSLTPGGGTLRTFGRAEPLPLAAAPPPRPADVDEYTLSRAVTLSVRRGAGCGAGCGAGGAGCGARSAGGAGCSDSESSGSPCADCSATYRLPTGRPAEAGSRGPTDSSAESAAEGRVRARRRPRRHHTPTAHRYQRQEQERRDFTIHV